MSAVDWDAIDLGERPDSVIAEELGVSVFVVGQQRRKRGIPACTPHGGRRPGTGRPIPPIGEDDLDLWERLFFEDGLSLTAIASRSDVRHSKQTISAALRRRRGVKRLRR